MISIGKVDPRQIQMNSSECRSRYSDFYNKTMFNIALNTFREMVRNRFFSLIIFLSVILVALSLGLDSLALGENKRVIIDF